MREEEERGVGGTKNIYIAKDVRHLLFVEAVPTLLINAKEE